MLVLFWFNIYDPTFMLGIWRGSDRMKERFGSDQSMGGWYVEVPDLVAIFIR